MKDTSLSFAATFTDSDSGDHHTATWTWGDGSTSAGSVNESTGAVTGTHSYAQAGTYHGTLTIADSTGTAVSQSFTVGVGGGDATAPVITVPADVTAEAGGPDGAVVIFTTSALDDTDGTVTTTASPASGSLFPVGTTTVTVTSTDAAGNVGTKTFKVTVADSTAPVLAALPSIQIEATSATGAAATFAPTATDALGATITTSIASGSVFPFGTTTVTVTATAKDALGNLTAGSFTITVKDTTAPKLKLPANLTVKAKSPAGAKVEFRASASDLVDERVKLTYSQAPGSTFPLGTTTVTVTATDDSGNVATGTFTVTVADKTKPEFTKLSVNPSKLTGGNHQMVAVTVTALAKDAIDAALDVRIVSVTSDEPATGTGPGDVGPDWQITGPLTLNLRNEYDPKGNGRIYPITVTATDDAGNTRTQTIHVLVGKKSSTRFEDCDDQHRTESQRRDDDDRDCRSRDRGDDDDRDHD